MLKIKLNICFYFCAMEEFNSHFITSDKMIWNATFLSIVALKMLLVTIIIGVKSTF